MVDTIILFVSVGKFGLQQTSLDISALPDKIKNTQYLHAVVFALHIKRNIFGQTSCHPILGAYWNI